MLIAYGVFRVYCNIKFHIVYPHPKSGIYINIYKTCKDLELRLFSLVEVEIEALTTKGYSKHQESIERYLPWEIEKPEHGRVSRAYMHMHGLWSGYIQKSVSMVTENKGGVTDHLFWDKAETKGQPRRLEERPKGTRQREIVERGKKIHKLPSLLQHVVVARKVCTFQNVFQEKKNFLEYPPKKLFFSCRQNHTHTYLVPYKVQVHRLSLSPSTKWLLPLMLETTERLWWWWRSLRMIWRWIWIWPEWPQTLTLPNPLWPTLIIFSRERNPIRRPVHSVPYACMQPFSYFYKNRNLPRIIIDHLYLYI